MADRTEAPTPRRRQEARAHGDIARSVEVNSAVGLLTAFTLFKSLGPAMSARLGHTVESLLGNGILEIESPEALRAFMLRTILPLGLAMVPFVGALMLAGVLASVAQVGFTMTGQALMPRWSRINPLSGLRRLFSGSGLQALLKAGAKITVIGLVAYAGVRGQVHHLLNLGRMELSGAASTLWRLVTDLGTRVGLVMLVIALADYIYQHWQFEKNLRMTRQELIEEMKRYENPIIRSRIRQQQRRIAMQRMMAAVPKADVVITNPTEFAVALSYDATTMRAPQVVAKGQRLVAQRIRHIAEENGVPIVERKPLARALFKMVEVGAEIPADLYQAVAEILAFIYSLRRDKR